MENTNREAEGSMNPEMETQFVLGGGSADTEGQQPPDSVNTSGATDVNEDNGEGSLTAVKPHSEEGPKEVISKPSPGGAVESPTSPEKKEDDGGSGAGSRFLRLPIFAGSSNVELDDKVEIPEEPVEIPLTEDDGLRDSLWTIQKREQERQGRNSDRVEPVNVKTEYSADTFGEKLSSDLSVKTDPHKEKSENNPSDVKFDEENVKLVQKNGGEKSKTPGKGKDSKSRNYRSNQSLISLQKSNKITDLYSDIDDDVKMSTTSALFEKNFQKDSEKSKKHGDKLRTKVLQKSVSSNKKLIGEKSVSDLFDDGTQDSVSDCGKLEDLDDFKLEKSPKPGELPTAKSLEQEDVKFEYEDSNDSIPSTSWSDAGIGSAIITKEEYNDKKWRLDKIQNMETELDRNPSSSRKSPKGHRRRSDSRGKEQDPGLLITVGGGSDDRSVAEKTDKNIEMFGQNIVRNPDSDRQSSKDGKEKATSRSRSNHREEDLIRKDDVDHHKSKSRRNRSRSRSKERRRTSGSRERRDRSRSRDRRERSRSRDRRERSRSRERRESSRERHEGSRSREKSRHKRERSWSLEYKPKERRDRSRSRERRERSRSREKRPERRRSKQDSSKSIEGRQEGAWSVERKHDQSRSVERRQEHSRSTERRRDRSRSPERRRERSMSEEDSRSWSLERSNKKSRGEKSSEKRRSRDVNLSPHRQESEERQDKEEKLDVFSYGIKRLHDGKSKKSKKVKTSETEPIVILSDDEQDPMPKRKSHHSRQNRIEPIITTRSSSNRHSKDANKTSEPPLPTEELTQPPMPPAMSNVVQVLTESRQQRNGNLDQKESLREEEARSKERTEQKNSDDEMESDLYNPECAYDPEFPTVDMEESPTEDQPIFVEEAAEHVKMNINPLLHKELPMQSISPLPGPPPPPMPGQGLLGEPSILLSAPAGDPPQSLLPGPGQQIPLQLRMLAPGFPAQQPGGLPPQRQLIVNHPVFMNRPGSFPHIQQLPAGHPLHPRLVSTPGGIVSVQNQFPPRISSLVSLPGQAGLLNGALDHLSHDPHLILASDPHGDPRLHHPPHPESRVISLRPEVPVVPMSVPENMPLSIASSEALSMNQPNIIPSVSQLEQISQITKLLNTQAQLAMFGKESKGLEHDPKQDRLEQKNSNNVFKVPLPPILTHTLNKVKSDKENLEMVDMDMSSPQDNGNIEIPTSSSEKSERSRRRDKKRSHRHRSEDHRHRSSHEDRVSSTVESQKTFDQIMDDINNADEIPSSAVELTNKEKYLRKLHLQERVVDEVKTALKPFYSAKKVNKEQYKEILRRAVPKVCHSKSGDINPVKIRALVDAYVAKFNRNMSPPKDEDDDQLKKKNH